MSTTATDTECPWCGTNHQLATSLIEDVTPTPGDVSICIECGRWCEFDAAMKLRRPTRETAYFLATDADCLKAQAEWRARQMSHGHARRVLQ